MDSVTASVLTPFNLREWLERGQSHLKSFKHFDTYKKVCWVYACANKTAQSASSIPMSFLENGKGIKKNHPIYPYFHPPYIQLIPSVSTLMRISVLQKELFGETFWYFDEKTKNIVPIYYELMDPILTPNNQELVGWEFQINASQKLKLTLDEVLFIKYPNPVTPLRGISPLDAARWATEAEINQTAWNAKFFKDGASPDMVINSKKGISRKQRQEIRQEIKDSHAGIAGSGVFVFGGDTSVQSITKSLKDIEFHKGRALSREEICAVMGVGPALVGIYQYSNYANAEFQGKEFWMHKILPILEEYKETLELQFQIMGYDIKVQYDMSKFIGFVSPLKERVEAAEKFSNMGLPLSESLRLSNIYPSDDIDLDALQPITPEPEEEPEQEPKPEEDENSSNINSLKGGMLRRSAFAWEVLENELLTPMIAFTRQYTKYMIREIKRHGEDFQIDSSFYKEKLEEIIDGHIEKSVYAGWNIALAELNKKQIKSISAMYDPPNIGNDKLLYELRPVMKALAQQFSSVSDTMAKQIELKAWKMMSQGKNFSEIEKAISKILVSNSYAKTISRAVVGGGYNIGKYLSFQHNGVTHHKWSSMRDGRVRKTHGMGTGEDGNIVPIGEKFPVTGMRFPHDPQGEASEKYGCRCITVPVVGQPPSNSLNKWFSNKKVVKSLLQGVKKVFDDFKVRGWQNLSKVALDKALNAGKQVVDGLRKILVKKKFLKMASSLSVVKELKDMHDVSISNAKKMLSRMTPIEMTIKIDFTKHKNFKLSGDKILIPVRLKDEFVKLFKTEKQYMKDDYGIIGNLFFYLGQYIEEKFLEDKLVPYFEKRISNNKLKTQFKTKYPVYDNDFTLPLMGQKKDEGTFLTAFVIGMVGQALYQKDFEEEFGSMFLRDPETFIKVMEVFWELEQETEE